MMTFHKLTGRHVPFYHIEAEVPNTIYCKNKLYYVAYGHKNKDFIYKHIINLKLQFKINYRIKTVYLHKTRELHYFLYVHQKNPYHIAFIPNGRDKYYDFI